VTTGHAAADLRCGGPAGQLEPGRAMASRHLGRRFGHLNELDSDLSGAFEPDRADHDFIARSLRRLHRRKTSTTPFPTATTCPPRQLPEPRRWATRRQPARQLTIEGTAPHPAGHGSARKNEPAERRREL
jgi:hypothetical protein